MVCGGVRVAALPHGFVPKGRSARAVRVRPGRVGLGIAATMGFAASPWRLGQSRWRGTVHLCDLTPLGCVFDAAVGAGLLRSGGLGWMVGGRDRRRRLRWRDGVSRGGCLGVEFVADVLGVAPVGARIVAHPSRTVSQTTQRLSPRRYPDSRRTTYRWRVLIAPAG